MPTFPELVAERGIDWTIPEPETREVDSQFGVTAEYSLFNKGYRCLFCLGPWRYGLALWKKTDGFRFLIPDQEADKQYPGI